MEISDPYAFFPDQLSDYDLHLIGEGPITGVMKNSEAIF